MRQPIRTIAIDIDDTLNNFSEILHGTNFTHNETYPFPDAKFDEYLATLRKETADEATLRSREFSFLRQTINGECYVSAVARPDGVEFVQSLKEDGWRIVICTHRDLRRTQAPTRQWLNDNGIPFDYLFIAVDKLAFCKDWGIEYLVDDHLYSIRLAGEYGVNVFYPIMAKHGKSEARLARGFRSFNEVRQWIPS
jgi:hypothetical protein